MKSIYCAQCKKNYKINYYYTHKNKSKKHLINSRTPGLLLETENNNNQTRNIKLFLEELKEKIEEFIKQII
jgi:recombinational DNA repair protein (RecF pathway)